VTKTILGLMVTVIEEVHMDWITIACLAAALIIAYLLGSVNFAIIITKFFAKEDIRDFGSGNAGMTNVLRTVGKGAAALTFVGDFAKGALAVLIARILFVLIAKQPDFFIGEYLAAFCGLLGHCFPVFYGFKGGKGIAISAGAMVVLSPLAFVFCLAAFLIFFLLTKIVSVGSLAAAVTFPIAIFVLSASASLIHPLWRTGLSALIALMVIFMHRANIVRLIHGEESSFKKKSSSDHDRKKSDNRRG
jgi:glycerol-3-phosphate acyltransferase PlsY